MISVQEEVQFKTQLYEKEKEKCKFLEDECKDLQREFERVNTEKIELRARVKERILEKREI